MTSPVAMIVNMQMDNEYIVNKAGRFESAHLTRHSSVSGFIAFELWPVGNTVIFNVYLVLISLVRDSVLLHTPDTVSIS